MPGPGTPEDSVPGVKPNSLTEPYSVFCRPQMILRSDVLPQPDGPSSP